MTIEKIVEFSKGKRYSEFKSELADVIIKTLAPIQERRARLAKNKKVIMKILADGAKKAHTLAAITMKEVRSRVGLI